MVILGADLHKRSHTVVVIDETGRKLDEKTVAATSEGHLELRRWAIRWPDRRWALEDCRHLSRRLEADLVVAGESVVRVPPKLMAGARRSAREPGKSDPIDALSVARAALREPDLPVARLDGPERDLRLLVDHREDLVADRTQAINRLRWHLHELLPGDEPKPRSLGRSNVLAELERRLAPLEGTVARIARELVTRIGDLSLAIDALEREIARLAERLAPVLLALQGCGHLSAGKLLGETAGIGRFSPSWSFSVTVRNSILRNSGSEIDSGTVATVSYSDVEGGYTGAGNIDADPQFASAPADYRLAAGSPCIDAGAIEASITTDLDGTARPAGNGWDIGAYETAAASKGDSTP